MKYSVFLSATDKKHLEFEIVSTELKIHLTRLIERNDDFCRHELIHKNVLINRSRTLSGRTIYVLEPNDEGGYENWDYAWHAGEFELSLRRLDTPRFIELICEVLERGWLKVKDINSLLKIEGASFRFAKIGSSVEVEVLTIKELEDEPTENEHPNIRLLVNRMEKALEERDVAAVLHASASIFETLAKDIVAIDSIQDQSLASFFDRYKKDSMLPDEILEKIRDTYKSRNTMPLAGHGSTQMPTLKYDEAVSLCEMTKAFVRIEYKLQKNAEESRRS